MLALFGSYFHMHISWLSVHFFHKFNSLFIHHFVTLFGLGCISWCGHQIHISFLYVWLVISVVDPAITPWFQDLLFTYLVQITLSGFSIWGLFEAVLTGILSDSFTTSLFYDQTATHHFYMSNVLIIIAIYIISHSSCSGGYILTLGINSNYSQLPVNLAVTSSLSITFAHHIYAMPMYFQIASDYPTMLCSLVHHMWIGGSLIMGGGAHASIFIIGNSRPDNSSVI